MLGSGKNIKFDVVYDTNNVLRNISYAQYAYTKTLLIKDLSVYPNEASGDQEAGIYFRQHLRKSTTDKYAI